MNYYIGVLLLLSTSIFPNKLINTIKFENISKNQGLTSNHITTICKDKYGYIWAGTHYGLNKYDSKTINTYKQIHSDPSSLSNNKIFHLFSTRKNDFLIATKVGVNKYDYFKNNFSLLEKLEKKKAESFIELDDTIYIVTDDDCIYKYSSDLKFISFTKLPSPKENSDDINYIKTFNYNDTSLVYAEKNKGIFLYNLKKNQKTKIANLQLNSDLDRIKIISINKNTLCISTYREGLYIIKKNKVRHIKFPKSKKKNLFHTYINDICMFSQQKLWVITDGGGIIVYDIKLDTKEYIYKNENPHSISSNFLSCIYQDSDKTTWVGTIRNGLDKYSINFFNTYDFYSNKNYSPAVHSIINENGIIWLGKDGDGLQQLNVNGELIKIDIPQKVKAIFSIYKYGDILLLGTYSNGLVSYNLKTKKSKIHKLYNTNIESPQIHFIKPDINGNILIGQSKLMRLKLIDKHNVKFKIIESINIRAFCYKKTINSREFIGTEHGLYEIIEGKAHQIFKSNYIFNILKNTDHSFWISSYNGLIEYNYLRNTKKIYNSKNGLNCETIKSMIKDNNQNLWLGTVDGLIMFDKENKRFIDYTKYKTIKNNEFFPCSASKLSDGTILMGGNKGVVCFQPNLKTHLKKSQTAVFTNLYVNGEKIENTNEKIIDGFLPNQKEIRLQHFHKLFKIEFNIFDFNLSDDNNYWYKLEGLDEDFKKIKDNSLSFMNIEPGDYNLMVSTSGIYNQTEAQVSTIKIIVKPAFWQTIWFRVLLIFLCLLSLIIILAHFRKKELTKQRIENEKYILKKQKEIDRQQLEFFTNMSHELLTPLTLIVNPVNDLLNRDIDKDMRLNLEFIKRNSIRMKKHIDMGLDYRKTQFQEPVLEASISDIVKFIKELTEGFLAFAKTKKISLEFKSDLTNQLLSFDKYMMETIVYNLLSNSFKYTKQGDRISVSISKKEDKLQIHFYDSGTGISAENQKKIFNKFFQSQNSKEGKGIGLAITKKFIEAHKGEIEVDSRHGVYTHFTINLPIVREDKLIEDSKKMNNVITQNSNKIEVNKNLKQSNILIVDDDLDIKNYLDFILRKHFQIWTANDGQEAKQILQEQSIDLVISDVMMPRIDGYELLKWIKEDPTHCNIPVILLTAKILNENRIEAYNIGADSYINKPFSIDLLLSRIENLLLTSQKIKNEYHKKLIINETHETIFNSDDRFIENFIEIVENNISNPQLDTKQFVEELGMSKSHIYRKIKDLNYCGIKDFISEVRLKHAKYMLENTNKTINEISDQVGFNNPKYFSTCFKKKESLSPSEYRKLKSSTKQS